MAEESTGSLQKDQEVLLAKAESQEKLLSDSQKKCEDLEDLQAKINVQGRELEHLKTLVQRTKSDSSL